VPKERTDWSTYSNVNHRLQRLDSPDPNGWSPEELAAEYGVSVARMKQILAKLVRDRHALITDEGRYIGSGDW